MKKIIAALLLLAALPLSAHAKKGDFFVGANLFDWECGDAGCWYGRDIGYNGWTDIHLAVNGYDPNVKFRREVWQTMFDDLASAGVDFVRIPLMSEGQGIRWKPWVDGRIDLIEGADPQWISNVRTLLDMAAERKMKVELGLFPGNAPRPKDGRYTWFYGKELVLTSKSTQDDYFDLVLAPFLKKVRKHRALYSIEVMGEADGAIAEGNVSADQVREFIRRSVAVVRKWAPTKRVTASTGYYANTPKTVSKLFRKLGLDYLEVHRYGDDAAIGKCRDWKKVLPVFLGEFGPSSSGPNAGSESAIERHQAGVTRAFLAKARGCGFFGAAMWGANPSPGTRGDAAQRFQNLYAPGGVAKQQVLDALRARGQ